MNSEMSRQSRENFSSVFLFHFGLESCGILAPWPWIEPIPATLEGEVLSTEPPGKSLRDDFYGIKNTLWWDFPGSPVAKTLSSQFRGPRFNPWSGTCIPHATTKDPTTKPQSSQVNKWKKVKSEICSVISDSMQILQVRILEWVSFSPPRGWTQVCLHCRWILYQVSHKGSPRILQWVAYPFSTGSTWPRNQTGVTCIAGRFFTNWVIREAPINKYFLKILYDIKVMDIYHYQFSWVTQSCPTLCDPMDCSTPGFPVHHQLPKLAKTHVHQVSDAKYIYIYTFAQTCKMHTKSDKVWTWMIILYHCRFILDEKCTMLVSDDTEGEVMHMCRQGIYGKSLYFPLNFVIKLKVL